jgi:glycosyltransferase involved in cell wall biosynthesis
MKLRLAVLWIYLTSYVNSCLKELAERHSVELDVTCILPEGGTPYHFSDDMFAWIPHLRTLPGDEAALTQQLLAELDRFDPHTMLIAGWSTPVYRQVALEMRKRGVYVVGTADNPWHGSLRQWGGVLAAPWHVRPLFDALWVPGERGVNFAKRLGFQGEKLLTGLYSADHPFFASIFASRSHLDRATWPRRFLFAGRLAPEKGVEDLANAWQQYHQQTADPWELWIAGSGPLAPSLEKLAGVRMLGFVQPEQYADILPQVGAFVLPSHYEPWGVVIHEMAAAGLPVLCSRQCGSSSELVQDGFNGFLFEARDVPALARLFRHVSGGEVDLPLMGKRSALLSSRYTPAQWADYLVSHLKRQIDPAKRPRSPLPTPCAPLPVPHSLVPTP